MAFLENKKTTQNNLIKIAGCITSEIEYFNTDFIDCQHFCIVLTNIYPN